LHGTKNVPDKETKERSKEMRQLIPDVIAFWQKYRKHILAATAIIVLIIHYCCPCIEAHAMAIAGVICAECAD
jgi:hypothetical protein